MMSNRSCYLMFLYTLLITGVMMNAISYESNAAAVTIMIYADVTMKAISYKSSAATVMISIQVYLSPSSYQSLFNIGDNDSANNDAPSTIITIIMVTYGTMIKLNAALYANICHSRSLNSKVTMKTIPYNLYTVAAAVIDAESFAVIDEITSATIQAYSSPSSYQSNNIPSWLDNGNDTYGNKTNAEIKMKITPYNNNAGDRNTITSATIKVYLSPLIY